MKPTLINGWVHCLALFMPTDMSEEIWEKMSTEERDKAGDWTAYRFDPKQVQVYNRSNFTKASVIRYVNGEAITIQGELQDLDIIFAK